MRKRINYAIAMALFLLAALGCRAKESAEEQTQAVEADPSAPAVSEPEPEKPASIPAPSGQLDPRALYNVPLEGSEPQRGTGRSEGRAL